MNVALLQSTPNALKVAFSAIRTCYSPHDIDYIWAKDWDDYIARDNDHIRLLKQIVSRGHTSTLEHITFTFSVENVSRALLAQLTRHRVGFSYSVQSQRYVKMSSSSNHGVAGVVIPDSIKNDPNAMWVFNYAVATIQRAYDYFIERGIKAEDARYILPNAATTRLVISFNLRAFMDFYSKRREGTHAQWEIVKLAELLKGYITDVEPWTAELFGKD